MAAVTVSPARLAAFSSLCKMKSGKYTNLEINAFLQRSELSQADRALYTALVYGVTERLLTLDYQIEKLASRPLTKVDENALWALRLGLYQLCYMDRIPPHAAVSESVSLAGKRAGGFVNALLRSFLRADCAVQLPKQENTIEYLSVKYSVPQTLCSAFVRWYGAERTEKIFEAFLLREKISLHVNTLRLSAKEAANRLGGTVSSICSDCVVVDTFDGVDEGLSCGDWFVQDEASALCAKILDAQPGQRVIDVCAAPGGKSCGAALSMNNQGVLYSFDLHGNKLSLIQTQAQRLGISILQCEERDARQPDPALIGSADRVLCDAPCSGLGVIGKKPDIKYKDMESVCRLPKIQYEVLCGAAAYVRPSGILMYSTCTLNPEENEEITRRFLKEHPEFAPAPFSFDGALREQLTLFPDVNGTDGFYICRMKRI